MQIAFVRRAEYDDSFIAIRNVALCPGDAPDKTRHK